MMALSGTLAHRCLPTFSFQRPNVLRRESSSLFNSRRMRQSSTLVRATAEPTEEQKAKLMEEAMKDPEAAKRMQLMQEQMKNPEVQAQVQEQMKNPEVQAQVQEMASVMKNPKFLAKMEELKEDPELKPMFDDMRKNGMPALMKYMNDPEWLKKFGQKMGDIGQGPPPQAAPAAAPEINNLLDAAKYGDLEAVEDFIAIGKDVNVQDPEGRSPLHYAVAFNRFDIAAELMSCKADKEIRDSKDNTPLHYAAGYGRTEFVKLLLREGANGGARNQSDHSPLDLVTMEPRNPINEVAEVMEMLKDAAKSRAFQDQ